MSKPIKDWPIFRTITGKNKAGRIIHSALDVLPIPNVHEIVKSAVKDNPNASIKDVSKVFFKKVDWLRTLSGVLIAVGITQGWFTMEHIEKVMELLEQILPLIAG